MLDLNLIREKTSLVQDALKKKGVQVNLDNVLTLDQEKRKLQTEIEGLRAERNSVSASIPKLKREGKDVESIFTQMRLLGEKIELGSKNIEILDTKLKEILEGLPNLPDSDVRDGGKENNEVIKTINPKPSFNFKEKNHYDLCVDRGLIDYERGVKLGGTGFWMYKGLGARLEWALLNYFIDEHLKDGYEFVLPPHLLNYPTGFGAGQFPKFEDDVFWIERDGDRKKSSFLLPTAETALVNMYANEILEEKDLPIKLFAYTPCYRKEAGGYGAEERGMIRGHQFNKVEMVQIVNPTSSKEAFEELTNKAISLVEQLGLHFQVTKLAAEDCSAAMARTYDIEVWIPSMNTYKEVSSVSNANDYQARRSMTRFRNNDTKKPSFVHTLNGSGLATSRLLPAIVEQFQNEDGSINVPPILQKYLDGIKII